MPQNNRPNLTVSKVSYVHDPDAGKIWWDFWLGKIMEQILDEDVGIKGGD